MISVACSSVSTTVTTMSGKAFLIAAKGHKRTLRQVSAMPALPPKADLIASTGVRLLRDWLSLFASVSVRIDFCKFSPE